MAIKHECGVFGGITKDNSQIANMIRYGLLLLQHRGQEGAGICCYDGNKFHLVKDKGLVDEVLTDRVTNITQGDIGIGHVRYSTQGTSDSIHTQPYLIRYLNEEIAIAHNGNIKDADNIRYKHEIEGATFITLSDTEVILKQLIIELKKPMSQWKLSEVSSILMRYFSSGAWSLLLCFKDRIMGFVDPGGYRPLVLGKAKEGLFLGSEDCAFHMLCDVETIEINPGEAIEISKESYAIEKMPSNKDIKATRCVFEHIYLAKSTSNIFNLNVYKSRLLLGEYLAREYPIKADIVVPVMDSGLTCALGYSRESNIPLEMGLLRNRWIGRTFIQPTQQERSSKVKEKLVPVKEILKDKDTILIDDSIVRGTTIYEIVKIMKSSGVKSIHICIPSPKIKNECYWGIDITDKDKLFANLIPDSKDMAKKLGVSSVNFLSLEKLKEIFGDSLWCYYCFNK